MGQILRSKSGVRRMLFDAKGYDRLDRLSAMEQFVSGAPSMSMGLGAYEPISAINDNFNAIERLVANDFFMARVNTSGYQLSVHSKRKSAVVPRKVTVCMIESGNVDIISDKERYFLKAGDIYVHQTHKLQTTYGLSRLTKIMYPSDYFDDLLGYRTSISILRHGDPITLVAAQAIFGLYSSMKNQNFTDLAKMAFVTRELTYNIIASSTEGVKQSRHEIIRERARSFVMENLGEPDVDVESIAKYANASRATLYRAFEKEGGVREMITTLRLNEARKILRNRAPARGLIVDVAFSCGFRSPNQFHRVFKERFGSTPSEYNKKLFWRERGTYLADHEM